MTVAIRILYNATEENREPPDILAGQTFEASTISTPFNDLMSSLYWEWRLQSILWKYVPPVLLVLGTTLNALTIIVLLRRKFGNSSTRILLIILALADSAVLLTGLIRRWLQKTFELELPYLIPLTCPLHRFLMHFFRDFSNWNIALLTVERWISVAHPLKARVICTRKYVCIVISIVSIFLFTLNSHILYYFRVVGKERDCDYTSEAYHTFWMNTWYWIDLFAYSCLPFVVISYCNCSIYYQVTKGQIKREKLQNREGCSGGQSAKLTSMTKMLTTVSVMFILLTLPVSVHFIVYGRLVISSKKTIAQYVLSYTVTNLLSYFNNSINFLLYCVSGTQFRREVFKMFRCQWGWRGEPKFPKSRKHIHI
jgi:hypothetical protein